MEHTKETDNVERSLVDKLIWAQERTTARLIAALLVAALLLAGWAVTETVLRHNEHREWLDFMAGYDMEIYDYAQDGQGVNIIGNGNGVTGYGPAVASAQNDP